VALWTVEALGSSSLSVPKEQAAGKSEEASAPSANDRAPATAELPKGTLDFGGVKATESQKVYSPTLMTALSVLGIGLFALVIHLSAGFAAGLGEASAGLKLSGLAPSYRLLIALMMVTFFCVQALGATDAYAQTHVVRESTLEYFQSLSRTRLCGMSHAHIFGYTVCYGFFAWAYLGTSASERAKCYVAAALIWAGLFDVASWWGIKEFSARFEWLSAATGATSASLSLFVAYAAIREMFGRPSRAVETPLEA